MITHVWMHRVWVSFTTSHLLNPRQVDIHVVRGWRNFGRIVVVSYAGVLIL